MPRILKEPLIHFLLLGAAIYWIYTISTDRKAFESGNDIEVSRDEILNYMQYKSKLFDKKKFATYLSTLSQEQKNILIETYIGEEILYREAKRMGLDSGDFIIKQRLSSKARFMIEDETVENFRPTNSEIEAYLKSNSVRYSTPPSMTFTHIFFDKTQHGEADARLLAEKALQKLERDKIYDPSDFSNIGDRFPFLENYSERTTPYIADHFGSVMVKDLLAATPNEKKWQGPFKSNYGYHIVLLLDRQPAHISTVEEIRPQLVSDMLQDKRDADIQNEIENLKKRYRITIDPDR